MLLKPGLASQSGHNGCFIFNDEYFEPQKTSEKVACANAYLNNDGFGEKEDHKYLVSTPKQLTNDLVPNSSDVVTWSIQGQPSACLLKVIFDSVSTKHFHECEVPTKRSNSIPTDETVTWYYNRNMF
jgi:hypothetical protein